MVLRWRCIHRRSILLTLDDGPGNQLTPRILDILAEHGEKAVFFLLGRNIAGNEKIVRRIAAEGHEIGSHGFDHLHAWRVWPWNNIRDIRKGWQAVDRALGTRNKVYHYRPPYGKMNLVTMLYLFCKRIPIIYWTLDSQDTWPWKDGPPSYELLSKKMSKGAVLLVHDFDRSTDGRDQYVLDIIKLSIDVARNCNLKMRTSSQLEAPSL